MGLGRESEADDPAQLSLTIIKVKRKSQLRTLSPVHFQVLRRWGRGESTGVDTLGVVVTILHVGGSGHMVVFHRTEAALGFGSHLSVGAALYRIALLPP